MGGIPSGVVQASNFQTSNFQTSNLWSIFPFGREAAEVVT